MDNVEEIINHHNNVLNFGNYNLTQKHKEDNFEFAGNIYKIKTYRDITRLEKNGIMIFESTPGTSVINFNYVQDEVFFGISGMQSTIVTMKMKENQFYDLRIDDNIFDTIRTNEFGKLSFNLFLSTSPLHVSVTKHD
jgi:hypothetical protein